MADILAGDTPMLLTVREWDQDRAPHQIRALPTLRPSLPRACPAPEGPPKVRPASTRMSALP